MRSIYFVCIISLQVSWLREEQQQSPASCGKQMGNAGRSEAVSDPGARLGEMQAQIKQLRKNNISK